MDGWLDSALAISLLLGGGLVAFCGFGHEKFGAVG